MAVTQPTAPTSVSINPAASTSTVNVTSGDATSFQTALTNAAFEQQIVLPVATYTGQFTLPVPSGSVGGGTGQVAVTSRPSVSSRPSGTGASASSRPAIPASTENFVTIISANVASLPAAGTRVALADASNMPTIVASNSSASNQALSASAGAIHHYRFVGIKFTTPQVANYASAIYISASDLTNASTYPHHISFERCIMQPDYDYGCRTAFEVDGSHIQWKDCYLTDCKQIAQGDSHAIFGYTGAGPYKIDNCRVEGMGESIFFGSSLQGGVAITPGYEYQSPADITITGNHITRPLSWKRDHASYISPCDTAGSGTVSSSSTTVTFSTSQIGLTGKYIKGATSGAVGLVASGSGTSWVVSWKSGTTFSAGESWRYNSGNLQAKGIVEFKSGQRVLIQNNIFENGWSDGQTVGGLQLTAREYGWFSDFNITGNQFLSCSGFGMGVGDASNSSGFGSAPRGANRMWVHNNLFQDANSTESTSLTSNSDVMALPVNAPPFGTLSGAGGNIVASGTTGSVTFTATAAQFNSAVIKTDGTWELWLCDGTNTPIGKATVTSVTDSTHLVGTVTSTFDSSATSGSGPVGYLWRLGPSTYINTRYSADSWVIEHNTIAGANVGHTRVMAVTADEGTLYEPVQAVTNFVLRNNLFHHGTNPNSGGGVMAQHNTDNLNVAGGAGFYSGDTNLASYYLDAATKVLTKNVWFGAQTISGNTYAQFYGDPIVGPSSGHANMFHSPDQGGGDANATYGGTSGSVGFTNYAGADFSVTGTYATAATDGTMIGADVATQAAIWVAAM